MSPDRTSDRARLPGTDQRATKRPLNGVALVFGLIFLGLSGGWFLVNHGVLDLSDLAWAVPCVLALAGFVGLAASLTRGRSARR